MHKVETILLVFQVWTQKWQKEQIKVYTNRTTAYSGLREFTLKDLPNAPLQEIWLLVIRWDIVIDPYWMEEKKNALADVLSCFDEDKLTVLFPNWQDPSHSMSRQPPTYLPHPAQPSLNA